MSYNNNQHLKELYSSNKILTKEILELKNDFTSMKEMIIELTKIVNNQHTTIQSINDFIYDKKKLNNKDINNDLLELEKILKN